MTATDVLVVSGEPLWPPVHGGRLRTGGIVGALARQLAVRVAAPVDGPPPAGIPLDPLPSEPPVGRMRATLDPAPRLGLSMLGHQRSGALVEAVLRARPGVVLFAQSYLAAVAPLLGPPVAVDFADVEVRRMVSLARAGPARARLVHGVEAAKARRWEPPVARAASVVAAAGPADVELLRRWGAAVEWVPNGSDGVALPPSPARGPVTFVAGFGYRPNVEAARFVVAQVWPRVRAADPTLGLRLVGRGAATAFASWSGIEGVEVVADPVDVEPFYREASVVLAPVQHGGGAQLKVTEALARRRVVVATPFSAAAAPPAAAPAVVVAGSAEQFAAHVLTVVRDSRRRWARERALVAGAVPTWDDACAPLVAALQRHVRSPAG